MTLEQISVIFFVGFLIFVGLVAFISSKLGAKQTSGSADVDYYLGGRSTPTVVLAFSYVTSSISAACFMGDPGIMSTVGWPILLGCYCSHSGSDYSGGTVDAENEDAGRKAWFSYHSGIFR